MPPGRRSGWDGDTQCGSLLSRTASGFSPYTFWVVFAPRRSEASALSTSVTSDRHPLPSGPRQPVRPAIVRGRWLRWDVVGLVVILSVLGACFGGLLGPFDLLTSLDAGRQVPAGHSPYDKATSPVFQVGHAFVYPAFVAWLFSPLSLISRAAATAVFTTLSAAALILACRWLGRPRLSTAALVLVSSTTVISLQMGTVNAFLLLGLASARRCRSRSPLLAGIVIGVAASMKLFLLPVLICRCSPGAGSLWRRPGARCRSCSWRSRRSVNSGWPSTTPSSRSFRATSPPEAGRCLALRKASAWGPVLRRTWRS